jgi:hypothetical protein
MRSTRRVCRGTTASEHPLIVKRFSALKGVTVEQAGVSAGNLGYTFITLRVRGNGTLRLTGVTLDTFAPGAEVQATQIGDNWPRMVVFGYHA